MTTPAIDSEYGYLLDDAARPAAAPAASEPAKPSRPTPPSYQVKADDCPYVVETAAGQETFYPHVGEWVRVVPVQRLGDAEILHRFTQIAGELSALQGDREQAARISQLAAAQMAGLYRYIKGRVLGWNWTDFLTGEPLPQPGDDAAVLQSLAISEVFWLIRAIQRNTPSQEKNG